MALFSSKGDKKNDALAGNSDGPDANKVKTKRELIAEKYQKLEARSQEIKGHYKWLEDFNRKISR